MIPRFAVRNWTLKLTALFLALLLWIAVRVEAPDRQSISGVPVQVVVNDPDWTLVGEPDPASVDVFFSGPMRALLALGSQPPPMRIVLDEISSADTVLALSRDWVLLSPESGVAVDELAPATISLSFDRLETATVPYEIRTVGSLRPGLAFAVEAVAAPARARVRGPARQLEQLSRILLAPLDLGELEKSGPVRAIIDTTVLGSGVSVDPRVVEVEFTLEPSLVRTFPGIEVLLENGADLEVEPAFIDVIVEGATSVVEALDATDIILVAQAPVQPLAAEGVEMAVSARNLPDFVRAQLAVLQVLVRPRSEGAPGGGGS